MAHPEGSPYPRPERSIGGRARHPCRAEPGPGGRNCDDKVLARYCASAGENKGLEVRLGGILETENSFALDALKSMKITDKYYTNIRKNREKPWFCCRSLVKQDDFNCCHNKMLCMALDIQIEIG